MREPLAGKAFSRFSCRITPACAGTTASGSRAGIRAEDHPRVCGNHPELISTSMSSPGSPPRVREPPTGLFSDVTWGRITPACAGTTTASGRSRSRRWDHPRVCGNHCRASHRCRRVLGSPPRVREPHDRLQAGRHRAGITPACAGTTRNSCAIRGRCRDHPRVCGNHFVI